MRAHRLHDIGKGDVTLQASCTDAFHRDLAEIAAAARK